MRRLTDHIQWRTMSGQPVVAHDLVVIPQSRALVLRLPHGFWVWNRPSGVRVEQRGRASDLPIVDLTRRIQLGLLGVGMVIAIVGAVRIGLRSRYPGDPQRKGTPA